MDLVTSMTSGGLLGGSGGPADNKYCLNEISVNSCYLTTDVIFVSPMPVEHIANTYREVSLV